MGSTTNPHRALTAILDRQLDVVSRRQALAAGVTEGALRHRLRPSGPWRVLLPTVYIAATGIPSIAQQQVAAQLYGGPRSVVTGSAAVLAHGIRAQRSEFVDVLVPLTRQRHDAGFVRLHRTSRMPDRVYDFGPIRFALAPRAIADTVRGLTSLREVRAIVADGVQRRCGVGDLVAELNAGQMPGSALFRQALGDVAEGIRSAAEGDLKDLLAKSGLPAPLFNASIFDAQGTFVARPDAWWPEYGVAVEVDSHEWHLSPHDHARTLERQRRMAKLGILVLPFTPRQIRTERPAVLAAIRTALASGRAPANLRTVAA